MLKDAGRARAVAGHRRRRDGRREARPPSILDATGLTGPADLAAAHDFLAPAIKRLRAAGRVLVLADPPADADSPAQAAARQALDGLVRSIGKELRDGSTANLLYVPAGAEGSLAVAAAVLPLRPVGLRRRPGASRSRPPTCPPARTPTKPLAGKVAVVTGAARGIGAAIAKVHGPGRRARGRRRHPGGRGSRWPTVANEIGGTALQLDITAADAPQRLIEHLRERHGGVDVVVHNAGITRDKLLVNMDAARWNSVMAVNLQAQLDITQALLDADGVLQAGRPDRLRQLAVGHRRQPRADQLRGVQGRRDRHGARVGAGVRRARGHDQRRRAGLHRHRDDGEDAAGHPRGRLPAELAAAGRAAGRRRRDDRLARRSRAAPGSTGRPCGSAASRCWGPDGHARCWTPRRTWPLLYAKAALTARGRGGDLPDTRLARHGVAVDPAHLADYARVCRLPLGDVLPVTYPHMLTFPLQMALMTDRVVPAGPARAGARAQPDRGAARRSAPTSRWTSRCGPSGSPRTAAVRRSTCCATVSAGGEEVWRSTSTYLARGAKAPDGAPEADDRGAGRRPRARSAATWRIPDDAGRRYAKVSGDVNPIHLSGLTAKAFGFKRAIAHGMWVKARVLGGAGRPAARRAHRRRRASASRCSCPSTVHAVDRARSAGGWDVAVRNADERHRAPGRHDPPRSSGSCPRAGTSPSGSTRGRQRARGDG